MNLSRKYASRGFILQFYGRRYSQKSKPFSSRLAENTEIFLTRNIGILAHIDAGKTTTTERMLFYSGLINHMGEVHHGNTVTDFMEQERERGITITSACVTFKWNKHNINLLDTPGHIDFTMEVEQTLSVMDGAIVILDGSAGVEAQTLTVWSQANRHKIPRIIYVNKMDKEKADFDMSVDSVERELKMTPLVLHLPLRGSSKGLEGIVDLLTLEKCEWKASDLGVHHSRHPLSSLDGSLWEKSLNARIKLTETLADLDDQLAEIIIADEKKLETISSASLKESIRKVTSERTGVAVLCGSSYKNVGVQLLMDAVVDYLPSPASGGSGEILERFGDNFCAKAFKVRHDGHKGPVTFFRIYSGSLSKGQKIYNVKKKKFELCTRLYVAYADDYEEVKSVSTGNIAAVTGLKATTSGELVISSRSVLTSTEDAKYSDVFEVFLNESQIPEPVFFCTIEAPSQMYQGALDKALSELEREDPSLRVSYNDETGQTVLGGMGELHLEIIKDRIRKEYKIDVETGPLQIAYKEALIKEAKDSFTVKRQIGTNHHSVTLTMSVLLSDSKESERLLLDKSRESTDNISAIYPKHLLAVKNGVDNALSSGPKLFCPVVNVKAMLHSLEVGKGTAETVITSAVAQCIKKLLKKGGTKLLEPIMFVEIVCSSSVLTDILKDLGRRRAELISTDARRSDMVLRALIPLSELLGYATELRILSSGTAVFSMEFHSYKDMSPEEEEKAVKSVTGFI